MPSRFSLDGNAIRVCHNINGTTSENHKHHTCLPNIHKQAYSQQCKCHQQSRQIYHVLYTKAIYKNAGNRKCTDSPQPAAQHKQSKSYLIYRKCTLDVWNKWCPCCLENSYYHKCDTIGDKQIFVLVMKRIHLKLIEKTYYDIILRLCQKLSF